MAASGNPSGKPPPPLKRCWAGHVNEASATRCRQCGREFPKEITEDGVPWWLVALVLVLLLLVVVVVTRSLSGQADGGANVTPTGTSTPSVSTTTSPMTPTTTTPTTVPPSLTAQQIRRVQT